MLLFDRGYPSTGLLRHILGEGYSFVARVRRKWNVEVDGIKTQGWVKVGTEKTPVRVIKTTLKTGEVETLLTNLSEQQLPAEEAGDLYFKRWGIETAYDMLKSKLQLENFSGKTKVSVLQDFYATIFLCILASAAAAVADDAIADSDKGKSLKYPRKANRNRVIGNTRDYFLKMLLEPNYNTRCAMMHELHRVCAEHPVSIVADRFPPRKPPRKKRFCIARKAVVR